ncbi:F-box/LRR-repeat protein 25-like isoform X2 [Miscanthus floridulus]|uniref:F-box/LRR-repeat protein 25-like isoform X2 n=1 Tax=Miscanthus floridulus TaxID=154761 RepID=UPI00345AC77C
MQLRSGRLLPPPLAPPQGGTRSPACCPEDRLSGLPDDLLILVLVRLQCAREAARKSVLSRRWAGLWKQLPELTFKGVDNDSVKAALACVTRPTLELLDIRLNGMVAPGDVSSLLGGAAPLAPDKLIVTLEESIDPFEADELHCLSRTTSLQLTAQDLYIAPPLFGEFTSLKSLFLHSCRIDLGAMLPVCPCLSILKISDYWGSDAITIHSSSLEELSMDITSCDAYDDGCIDIVCPVLKKVEVEAGRANMLRVSFLAPVVEELCWSLKYDSLHLYSDFFMVTGEWCLGGIGVWFGGKQLPHINILRLDIHCTCLIDVEGDGERQSTTEAIARLPVTNFSVLELYISANAHVIGSLVSCLLQILPAIQKLKLVMVCQSEIWRWWRL